MRYDEFRDTIERALREHPDGLTWAQLRDTYALPYVRACPTWTHHLEQEIALTRERSGNAAAVWRVPKEHARPTSPHTGAAR